jgi:hypothetical protein
MTGFTLETERDATLNNGRGYVGAILTVGLLAICFVLAIISIIHEDRIKQEAELKYYDQVLVAPKIYLEAFQKPHRLHRLKEDKVTEATLHGNFSGAFFLIFGGVSGSIDGKSEQKWTILFSWEYKDPNKGTLFLLDRLYFDQVMVQFDQNAETPTIEFNFKPFNRKELIFARKTEPYCDQSFIDEGYSVQPLTFCQKFRINAIIRCRAEHWPKDIKLPL